VGNRDYRRLKLERFAYMIIFK